MYLILSKTSLFWGLNASGLFSGTPLCSPTKGGLSCMASNMPGEEMSGEGLNQLTSDMTAQGV